MSSQQTLLQISSSLLDAVKGLNTLADHGIGGDGELVELKNIEPEVTPVPEEDEKEQVEQNVVSGLFTKSRYREFLSGRKPFGEGLPPVDSDDTSRSIPVLVFYRKSKQAGHSHPIHRVREAYATRNKSGTIVWRPVGSGCWIYNHSLIGWAPKSSLFLFDDLS